MITKIGNPIRFLLTVVSLISACGLHAQKKSAKAAPSLIPTVPTKTTKQLSQDMAAVQKDIKTVTGENKVLKDSLAKMNVRLLAATNAANSAVKKVDALPKVDTIAVNKTPVGKLYVDFFIDPKTRQKTIQLKTH